MKRKYNNKRIYSVLRNMKARCYCKKHNRYKNYGARGIKICDEWLGDINCFAEWAMNNGYDDNLQIDRINIDGDYEPDNCHFVTNFENNTIGKQRIRCTNTSGYTGISFVKNKKTWSAIIRINGKYEYLGSSKNKETALQLRINREIEFFGEQKTNLHYKGVV